MNASAAKFDAARAGEYEQQSRIALAGYEACHDLAACILSASLERTANRRLLVVGAGGTAQEVQSMARLQPTWRFTAVDPSAPMVDLAKSRLQALDLAGRVQWLPGSVEDLPAGAGPFDAATLIGVLHHVPGTEAKLRLLRAIAARLPDGAPLVLACNRHAYASRPLLLQAWAERWRMHGSTEEEVQAKLGKILQGADPPESEQAVFALLASAGFVEPQSFFSSLFWGAWVARKAKDAAAR